MNNFRVSVLSNFLIYEKGYTPNLVRKLIDDNQLNGLRIFAHLKEDKLNNLDFLKDYNFLKGLEIATIPDFNYDFLKSLTELKQLNIQNEGISVVDLSKQINLESLSLEWRKGKIIGIENCHKLKTLCLVDYKEDNLNSIKKLKQLKNLIIKNSSIKTLSGLEGINFIEHIFLGSCKYLKSIKEINKKNNLLSLSIQVCSQINDYESLEALPNLESLQIIDCKEIKSIKFIQNYPKLKKLSLLGNTDVLDGDMTPALRIKEVIYKQLKHYNVIIANKKNDSLTQQNLEKIKKNR